LTFLKDEVERLESFKIRLDVEESSPSSRIPELELKTIKQYYNSILTAYKAAYEQGQLEELSNEVWTRHRDEWYWEQDKTGSIDVSDEAVEDDDDDNDDDDEDSEEDESYNDEL
jgi:hypothetical protein